MRNPIIGLPKTHGSCGVALICRIFSLGLSLGLALSFSLTRAAAQSPTGLDAAAGKAAAVRLVPSYPANARFTYAIDIHTGIGSQASMDTRATAEIHILPGAMPGRYDADLRFLAYHTTAQADDPAAEQKIKEQATASDHAATSMTPVHVHIDGGQLTLVARPMGAAYDQPVEMLVQLARTDSLPKHAVHVGDRWTHQRTQPVPTLDFSVPLTLDSSLTRLVPPSAATGNQPAATVTVHAHGQARLPPNAMPGASELAAQGLVPEASIRFDTTAVSDYRLPDVVLLQTHSDSHNHMHVRFIGPSPNARTTDTDIHSTATVKLTKVTGDAQ